MPTFCRHNRFIERCPICSETLPGTRLPEAGVERATAAARPACLRQGAREARRPRGESYASSARVAHRTTAFAPSSLPGVRASADADRLAEEIAFANGQAAGASERPVPGLYAEARALAEHDLEAAAGSAF